MNENPGIGRIGHVYFTSGYVDEEEHPICVAGIMIRISEKGVEFQLFPAYTLSASMLLSLNITKPLQYRSIHWKENATWHWPTELHVLGDYQK